jgi:hypothetical protein
MLNKFHTVRSVLLTYGVGELFRLVCRKVFRVQVDTKFETGILFESADRFMATIQDSSVGTVQPKFRDDQTRVGFFGPIYDLGPELSRSLLGVLIEKKPSLVIETGVAAGKSTNLILNQLRLNRVGHLVSIDVTRNVGELIEKHNRILWTLEVLPDFARRLRFEAILRKYSKTQIFLHDSDHSVAWQLFEIKKVTERLSDLSYILVDDVQPAVADFLKSKFGSDNCFFFSELGKKKSLIVRSYVRP